VSNATSAIFQRQDDDTLYSWSCVVWETHFDCGKPPVAKAYEYLEQACPRLIRERGIDAVRRTIRRAYEHIEAQMKDKTNGS
jgi:hypothetical protein